MKFFDRVSDKLENDISFRTLMKAIMILLIIWLCKETDVVWKGFLTKAWKILEPFLMGFVIAYVLRPLIRLGEKHRISRKITIPVLYALIIMLVLWLLFTLVPLVYSRLSGFITSLISGVNWLYAAYADAAANGVPDWMKGLVSQAVSALNDTKSLIPNLSTKLPEFFSTAIANITNTIFTVIISIYISYDWEHAVRMIVRLARRRGQDATRYLYAINDSIGSYIRSLLILMLIKFGEYALVYSLVGHPDWLILALLTSLGLIVPYLGPTLANIIAILTALTMPMGKIITIIIMILILSNVDEYLITPIVHSRNTKIPPLWALFSVFVGGILFGTVGIMVAIPVFLCIRTVIELANPDLEVQPEDTH